MELQVKPLKWKRAKVYGVVELPDPSAPPVPASRTTLVTAMEPAFYIVPRTKEEPYEAAATRDEYRPITQEHLRRRDGSITNW